MRKWIAALLALTLAFVTTGALAEEIALEEQTEPSADDNVYEPLSALDIALLGRPVSDEPTHVTVGSATPVSGCFFTELWGNNTSDMDVRALLHGYDIVAWHSQVEFVTDPMVVSSVETSTQHKNTVYTIRLQNDLTYSDGETAITARDYVFSYLLCASPALAELGAASDRYAYIVGYDDYHSGKTDALSGVRLIDDMTFSVAIAADYEPYFYDLATIRLSPYPISVLAPGCAVEDSEQGARIIAEDAEAEEPPFSAEVLRQTVLDAQTGYLSHPSLTSGPYVLTSYDATSGQVDFALNPYYKGNYQGVKPIIDTLTLVHVTPDTMVEKLESGEVDLLNKCVGQAVDNAGLALAGASGDIDMESYARIGYGFCAFACEKGPQQFQAVRQALACALDADALIADYLGGYGLRVNGYYGVGQWMTLAAMGAIRPETVTEKDDAAWNEISLDTLDAYNVDMARALELLEKDGWTLNESGVAFDPTANTLRYKQVDGALMPLSLVYAQTEGQEGSALVAQQLLAAAPALGMEITVKEMSFTDLLSEYYRTDGERGFDLCLMATNFVANFDPYYSFAEGQGNLSGLKDKQLTELAWEMHQTEPKNYLGYEQKWLAFQQRFNELLPTLPLYSNVYFDFHTNKLQNYEPVLYASWPAAILYAYYAPPQETPAETDETVPAENAGGEDEMIIID